MRIAVSAGYGGLYRDTAWVPVWVTLQNTSGAPVAGTVEIPQNNRPNSAYAPQSFRALYETPLTMPAGTTKRVLIYVPGWGVDGEIDVAFRQGVRTLAAASTFPVGLDSSVLLIGAMTQDPAETAWVDRTALRHVTAHVVALSPDTLDAQPGALATLDVIVLTDVDTSQLDRAQFGALETWVQNGGSLVLVGGPNWQTTLRPLPPALVPGRLVGMRTLRVQSLKFNVQSGIGAQAASRGGGVRQRPRHEAAQRTAGAGESLRPPEPSVTAVGVLARPSGVVLASEAGVPLVVRKIVGAGTIEYVGFDPAVANLAGGALDLPGAGSLSDRLEHLITLAAPLAATRTWSLLGLRARHTRAFTSQAVSSELANIPAAPLPQLSLLGIVLLAYVVLLGPAQFALLRRMRRPQLTWITLPALALACVGATVGIATHTRAASVVVDSIGVVNVSGGGTSHIGSFDVGVAAPASGSYTVSYGGSADALVSPHVVYADAGFRSTPPAITIPLRMQVQEGAPTGATLLAMKSWSVRDVELQSPVRIRGRVRTNLRVDRQGDLVGTIVNGTNLDLLHPVLVAGQSTRYLPSIPAGGTITASVRPTLDVTDTNQGSMWSQLYGNTSPGYGGDGFGWGPDCCDQFSPGAERTLQDRIRNAVTILLGTDSFTSPSEVALLAWTDRPLVGARVDGSTPRRRDLTLIVDPVSVRMPARGSFRLRPGTLGAHLVDLVPRAPQSNCCNGFSDTAAAISVGPGGSLGFEFDVPDAGHVRFRSLALQINDGTDGGSIGNAFDWRRQRWVPIGLKNGSAELSQPARFISPQGHILFEVRATGDSGDINIDDPYQYLALSGSGSAS